MRKQLYGISQYLKARRYATDAAHSTGENSNKAYSATLLLPNTSFPVRANPSVREVPFRQRTTEDLYKWQWENAKGPLFVLHDGPPYANGNLHMGHALNKILKDIINRFHVLLGHRVHYLPGWDCHGLPIENKALQELKANHRRVPATKIREIARKTALHEISVQKAEFQQLGIMADWNNDEATYRTMDHQYEVRQLRVFQALVEKGLIYRQYRPVYYSPASRSALAEAELVYVDGHMSRSVYVTYDCKIDSMSDGLKEVIVPHSPELNLKFLIWTTTPWTLPTNMGIAVNAEMQYSILRRHSTGDLIVIGSELLGSLNEVLGEITVLKSVPGSDLTLLKYRAHFQREGSPYEFLPIIQSSHVTSLSGTGLVHCAPAHGVEDYHAFLRQDLLTNFSDEKKGKGHELLCLVGPDGTFLEQSVKDADWLDPSQGERLAGKKVLKEGSSEVIEILRASGHLLGEAKARHRYPYDWKTNTPIIVTATSQWFADLSDIKTRAAQALKTVQFHPEISRTRLESFVRDRSEWCISRQRPWGVPIPALYNEATEESILSTQSLNHIIAILEAKGVDYWWSGPVDDFVAPEIKERYGNVSWKKGTDTMDVWFDSGTAWTLLAGNLPSRIDDIEGKKMRTIADVCLEGSDQHRGWFQSLLLTTVGVSNQTAGSTTSEQSLNISDTIPARPYATIITHGFVLDKNGKKMSKSLGNVISPMTIVHGGKNTKEAPAYGADVLRLWAATVDYGRDTPLSQVVIQQAAESLRKIRNSSRFILGNVSEGTARNINPQKGEMTLADRYTMFQLYQLEKLAKEAYTTYRFAQVVTALDRFTKITLSSLYFDITKDALYADSPESASRHNILWVMNEILETMNMIMAPILPHLSEEIHDYQHPISAKENLGSVFTKGWKVVDETWNDPAVEYEMNKLLNVRNKVLRLLELARTQKQIKSSLEAVVDIIVSNDSGNAPEKPKALEAILLDHESFLKTLFIVSDVAILDEGSLGVDAPNWSISETMEVEGSRMINVRVRPSSKQKCPRCWTFTRSEQAEVCDRCSLVLPIM
ncbi:tRNA synthetases class I-domain-containing protein [Hysterangium stoloniferum]|nr:tRNA synthetases class I-domain-containing protein [Hysterangium stoloniferum]